MDYVIGAVLAFVGFIIAYAAGAAVTAFFVARMHRGEDRSAAYDRATGPALLVALAAGAYTFYSYAVA